MSQKPETGFRQRQVLPFLKQLTSSVIFSIQQFAIVGTPDFLLCMRGRFVALELKSTDGKLSKLQEYNLKKVEESGGVAIVASPENWAHVRYRLARLDSGEE